MKKENYRIEGMTMAIKNMAQMLEIYSFNLKRVPEISIRGAPTIL